MERLAKYRRFCYTCDAFTLPVMRRLILGLDKKPFSAYDKAHRSFSELYERHSMNGID